MDEAPESEFPGLFCHQNRSEWGVGVLSGEHDGKRRYLFEGGEERTIGAAHADLMRKVDLPNREQQATYARLTALLAKRTGHAQDSNLAVVEQLQRFRQKHGTGLSSESWLTDETRVVRLATSEKAKQVLASKALKALATAKQLDTVWHEAVTLMLESGLVTEEPTPLPQGDDRVVLAEAILQLLHGTEHAERRFDAFVSRYEAVFHKPPTWEVASALPALVAPLKQVCVEPISFRKQLKRLGRQSALGSRPNGASYTRCVAMARALASALAAQGEVPRDLLEVHDFIRATTR